MRYSAASPARRPHAPPPPQAPRRPSRCSSVRAVAVRPGSLGCAERRAIRSRSRALRERARSRPSRAPTSSPTIGVGHWAVVTKRVAAHAQPSAASRVMTMLGRRDARRHPEPRAHPRRQGRHARRRPGTASGCRSCPNNSTGWVPAQRARRAQQGQHAPLRRPGEADGDAEAQRRDHLQDDHRRRHARTGRRPPASTTSATGSTASTIPSTGRSRSARARARRR